MMPCLVAILNIAFYTGSDGLNQQTQSIIMFSDPTTFKIKVLHKIIALLVLKIPLLAAILNIAIYDRSGDRLSRRPGETENVWYKLHMCQI